MSTAAGSPLLPTAYHLLWAAIPLLVLLAAIVAIIAVVRRVPRRPRTVLPVAGSKAERLAELDDLLAAGAITPKEHADARRAVLRS